MLQTTPLSGEEMLELQYSDKNYGMQKYHSILEGDSFTLGYKNDVIRDFHSIQIKDKNKEIVYNKNFEEIGCVVACPNGFLIGREGVLARIEKSKSKTDKK